MQQLIKLTYTKALMIQGAAHAGERHAHVVEGATHETKVGVVHRPEGQGVRHTQQELPYIPVRALHVHLPASANAPEHAFSLTILPRGLRLCHADSAACPALAALLTTKSCQQRINKQTAAVAQMEHDRLQAPAPPLVGQSSGEMLPGQLAGRVGQLVDEGGPGAQALGLQVLALLLQPLPLQLVLYGILYPARPLLQS